MKIKIEFEIPGWTRWLGVGAILGSVLGYGVASVRAAGMSVSNKWKQGDLLTADALNQNFEDLRSAINAQQSVVNGLLPTDCPGGYTRDTSVTIFTLCTKGNDQVVKVGIGGAAFWIDRFEASIWSNQDGTGKQFGAGTTEDFPSSFPGNGQYTTPLYATSQPNCFPSGHATWHQADAACGASGKRLPSGPEWLRAARGTSDPNESNGAGGTCNTKSQAARRLGEGTACRSVWGAEDMIGNMWEYSNEWYATLGTKDTWGSMIPWSDAPYAGDVILGVTSMTTTNTGMTEGHPAVALRGGAYVNGTWAGVFAIDFGFAPSANYFHHGFRCVTPR